MIKQFKYNRHSRECMFQKATDFGSISTKSSDTLSLTVAAGKRKVRGYAIACSLLYDEKGKKEKQKKTE